MAEPVVEEPKIAQVEDPAPASAAGNSADVDVDMSDEDEKENMLKAAKQSW